MPDPTKPSLFAGSAVRLLFLAAVLAGMAVARADTSETLAAPYDPTQHWELDYESGVLWRFTGDATPLAYTVLPQLVTVKSPLVGDIRPFFGGDLVIRNRFSLLVEPILVGPEHHFYGGSASGEMEWWDHRRTHCLFFAAGGGIGWLDSKGHEVKGGQGEDFNFNWLLYPGVRFMFRHRLSASVGLYFQHVSNRYLNSVNPGLNAIGPMVSVGWHY
jgi:lipid A 3-O-deacylase